MTQAAKPTQGVLVSGHLGPDTYLQAGGLQIRYRHGAVSISLPGYLNLMVIPMDKAKAAIVAQAADIYPQLEPEKRET